MMSSNYVCTATAESHVVRKIEMERLFGVLKAHPKPRFILWARMEVLHSRVMRSDEQSGTLNALL
jgi:hypothetical protein